MKYEVREDRESKWGVISNSHGFLNRHMDTGFKTKWSGFWSPPYKFLDYYALKVNGIWLDGSTVEATEYGDSIVHHHSTEILEVDEEVEVPEGFPGFRIKIRIRNPSDEPKAVQTRLEPGIDIRHRTEDVPEEEHEVDEDGEKIILSRKGRKMTISSDELDRFDREPREKEHFPGERQICTVPGELSFRSEVEADSAEEITVEFRTDDASFMEVESSESLLEDSKLSRGFNYSVESLENLVYGHRNGGVIAGHPWFQNYWARDTYWTVLGMVDGGMFETAERILENFASRQGFPRKIKTDDGRTETGAEDSAPLFVIAADKLEKFYGLSELLREKQEEAMEELEIDNGIVQHDPEGTWMDTLERSPAVEIQSLWLEAAEIMNDDRAAELESGLRDFESGEMVKDTLDSSTRSVNFAVPLMFDHFKDKYAYNYLEMLNGEFSSRYGARTRSMVDKGYDASGYHTGSSWGLTTCWAAMANFRHGKNQEGINMLEKLNQFLDRNHAGALPEVVDSESGELLGCGEQAWSAGLYIHAVDSYLLGIEVKDDHVEIDPARELNLTRLNKRVGNEKIDIQVHDGEVEILNSPDIEIIKW